MCTVFYLKNSGLLSKNRDKEKAEVEEVVQTDEMIAVRTQGASYYSLGINRHGCAFVSTAVNSPAWTAAIESRRLQKASQIMAAETSGRVGPTSVLSELLPTVESVNEWLEAIDKSNFKWRGYNLIMVDPKIAVHVEAFDGQISLARMEERYICTNHFRSLNWGPKKPSEYQNSFDRFIYAQEKIPLIQNHDDLFGTIAPDEPKDRKRIWRNDSFQTISSTVIDLNAKALHRCTSEERIFKRVSL
jgi:hypothetical protein